MIDLYTWSTPNGRKISIMLEELNLEYKIIPINITKDEQMQESFLKLSPNNKIPAIEDHDNKIVMMESGSILLYLSKIYSKFFPTSEKQYWKEMDWLMFQKASLGPMLGQAHHFLKFNKGKSSYAEERYQNEVNRLYSVLDKRLEDNEYIGGKEYGITDISTWPWISRYDWHNADILKFKNIMRWYINIANRKAVIKGYDIPSIGAKIPIPE